MIARWVVLLPWLVCCGPVFRAAELDSVAGAASGGSSEAGTTSVISAGGAIDPVGGSGGVAGSPLPGNTAGNGGEIEQAGAAGNDAGGAAGSSSVAYCAANWAGSSCDTCTHAEGRDVICSMILDCYAEHHCGPSTCAELCEFNTPLGAEQVASKVYACRCAP